MKIKKIFLISIIIAVLVLIVMPFKTNAALQSNGDSPAKSTIPSWMWQIRNMQAAGGTLGKRDVINSNLTTTESTDLDIHMEKNTEYGAMILLSASQYGKPNKVNDGETTTGNATGIVMKINKEWVAASAAAFEGGSYWASAVAKYKNVYPAEHYQSSGSWYWRNYGYQAKVGDAVLNWHGSTSSVWLELRPPGSTEGGRELGGILRAYSGSLFSYYGVGRSYYYGDHYYDAYAGKAWPTRAVIVNGEGI